MAADISAVTYFAPIAAFLIVFIVSFAVLYKLKFLGDSKWLLVFASLLIAALFVSASSVRLYVETVTPWFAALLLSLVFMLVLFGFVGVKNDKFIGGLGIVFVILAFIVFLVSGVMIFSDSLAPYLPGMAYEGNLFTDWLYSAPVVGALVLIVISSVVAWVLVKTSGGK